MHSGEINRIWKHVLQIFLGVQDLILDHLTKIMQKNYKKNHLRGPFEENHPNHTDLLSICQHVNISTCGKIQTS